MTWPIFLLARCIAVLNKTTPTAFPNSQTILFSPTITTTSRLRIEIGYSAPHEKTAACFPDFRCEYSVSESVLAPRIESNDHTVPSYHLIDIYDNMRDDDNKTAHYNFLATDRVSD